MVLETGGTIVRQVNRQGVCHLSFNFHTSTVQTQWKQAIIQPVNKIPIPKSEADYRPISITPVLSRLMERLVVQNYIYPAFLSPPSLSFSDQYAFRPTGSTNAADICLINKVTNLLTINAYVIVYGLDFRKAFDTVRHSTLLQKIALLDLSDFIYNWLVDCFEGRSHSNAHNDLVSEVAHILASIIQGSVIGLASYVVNASDLHTVKPENDLVKYADDKDLIVAEEHMLTRFQELDNISTWADVNNLKFNKAKSVEIVFRRPRGKKGGSISTDSRHRSCGGILISRGNFWQ